MPTAGPDGGPPWTVGGTAVPSVSVRALSTTDTEGPLWPQMERAFPKADPEIVERAAIPAERIMGPVLLLSGTDEKQWQSQWMADRACAPQVPRTWLCRRARGL